MLNLLAESLQRRASLGLVAPGDTRVFAYLTVGAIKELLYQAVRREFGGESAARLTSQVIAFLSGGYLRASER